MTDFGALLAALSASQVEFIIVGGLAAVAHGVGRTTFDLDIVYKRTHENIRRLVDAIRPMQPYLRGAPQVYLSCGMNEPLTAASILR